MMGSLWRCGQRPEIIRAGPIEADIAWVASCEFCEFETDFFSY
jgi:hypothetical protein